MAIRHAIRKPVVQIIQSGESIPFDVAATRTIQVNHKDLDSVAKCKKELISQIRSAENDPSLVDTPISIAIDLKFLRQSENPLEKSNAEIISMLQDLKGMMGDFATKFERGDFLKRELRYGYIPTSSISYEYDPSHNKMYYATEELRERGSDEFRKRMEKLTELLKATKDKESQSK